MNLIRISKLVVSLFALTLVAASCTGTDDESAADSKETTTTTAAEEPTTTTSDVLPEYAEATRPSFSLPEHSEYSDPGQAIIETYLNFIRAELIAFGAPEVNPDYGPWLELTTGNYQEKALERMAQWKEDGWVQVLPEDPESLTNTPTLRPGAFTEAEGVIVGLNDCYVDSTTVVNRSTGELIEGDTVTFSFIVAMTFTDGRWKVSNLATNETYEGVSTCPDL